MGPLQLTSWHMFLRSCCLRVKQAIKLKICNTVDKPRGTVNKVAEDWDQYRRVVRWRETWNLMNEAKTQPFYCYLSCGHKITLQTLHWNFFNWLLNTSLTNKNHYNMCVIMLFFVFWRLLFWNARLVTPDKPSLGHQGEHVCVCLQDWVPKGHPGLCVIHTDQSIINKRLPVASTPTNKAGWIRTPTGDPSRTLIARM